jgi:2-dehydropantoate 2-reductase
VTVTIWGAGSVGLVVGARLARSGETVHFVCRSSEAARRINRDGVHFQDAKSNDGFSVRASAGSVADASEERIGNGPVLLCVRTSHTQAATAALARATSPETPVACVQNGLDGEPLVAARFSTVIGAVYRQTCTRRAPNTAVSAGVGRVVLGLYPEGQHLAVRDLAARIAAAGYVVGVSERIGEDKWLKLCINLMSAPNALIRRGDHTTREFIEIKACLLEEARSVLRAAGIRARSCDGKDRSLEEEIEFQRGALERGESARELPLYNQVWNALRNGGPVEADDYHRRIIGLAAAHGVEVPMNSKMLAALERAVRRSLGPESATAYEILDTSIEVGQHD